MQDENQLKDKTLRKLTDWGGQQEQIRALILTSSRSNPSAPVDVFSDYDVIVVVKDIQPFFQDKSWLEEFGKVLVVYRDPIELDHGIGRFRSITQYEDGN